MGTDRAGSLAAFLCGIVWRKRLEKLIRIWIGPSAFAVESNVPEREEKTYTTNRYSKLGAFRKTVSADDVQRGFQVPWCTSGCLLYFRVIRDIDVSTIKKKNLLQKGFLFVTPWLYSKLTICVIQFLKSLCDVCCSNIDTCIELVAQPSLFHVGKMSYKINHFHFNSNK